MAVKKYLKKAFTFDGLSAELTYKNIKNLYIRFAPSSGTVNISAPLGMDLETIREFLLSKKEWITRQSRNLPENLPEAPPAWCDGEIHLLWGKEYRLKVEERMGKPRVEPTGAFLRLSVPRGADMAHRGHIMEEWRKVEIMKEIALLKDRWERPMGVKVESVTLRRMKTRWGSCTPSRKTIRLNTALSERPKDLLEYVLVHEMAHIRVPGHGRTFWSLVENFLPDWRVLRERLRKDHPMS